MAAITVQYDPQIELSEITVQNVAIAPEENPDVLHSEYQQTRITGIISPLVKLNNVAIDFSDIKSFRLESYGPFPSISMCIRDSIGFTRTVDQPQVDNILRVEILPQFDGVYSKINLNFYITDISIVGEDIYVQAIYNIPNLYNCRLQSLGNISSWEMFDTICKELQLGFASNISEVNDKRWIYCNNCSYYDLMEKEIQYSGEEQKIMDYWVDWWNYLNFADIMERFTAIDDPNDLTVWVQSGIPNSATGSADKIEPSEADALISNDILYKSSPLYCDSYITVNNTGPNVLNGTDKVCEWYDNNEMAGASKLIQDTNASNDIFTKTLYLGTHFGETNYLLQKVCNEAYKQKVNAQCIKVFLNMPCFGLQRGHRVQFEWKDSNLITRSGDPDIETNTPMMTNVTNDNGSDEVGMDDFVINKQISGQYLIVGSEIIFNMEGNKPVWKHVLLLSRPNDKINTYMGNE